MTHELKCWPEFYQPTIDGDKQFEFRRDDRPYSVDDQLVLREFKPCERCKGTGQFRQYGSTIPSRCGLCGGLTGDYTGRISAGFYIGYILRPPVFGVPEGFCIMSIYRSRE